MIEQGQLYTQAAKGVYLRDLNAVKDAEKVREQLRKNVELLRDQKRVREVDFDETGDTEFGDELG